MKGHGGLRATQSNLSLPSTFYPLNTFSNLHASRLLISTTWDGVLGPVGRSRACRRCPRPDGVPPGRELQRSLLVCSQTSRSSPHKCVSYLFDGLLVNLAVLHHISVVIILPNARSRKTLGHRSDRYASPVWPVPVVTLLLRSIRVHLLVDPKRRQQLGDSTEEEIWLLKLFYWSLAFT
jgi:hypothetical protein